MMRYVDWEQRLSDYLASVASRPFKWGEHDCALHIANAVAAITGDDIAADFRGKYSTELGSARALKRFGAGTLEATIDTLLDPIEPAFAQRGDVVMRDGMLGVCVGATAAFVGEEGGKPGLVEFPRREWQKAWASR